MRRICVIAGDISPIDVITHLPVLCEENDIPYIYVPSKEVCRSVYAYFKTVPPPGWLPASPPTSARPLPVASVAVVTFVRR